MRFVVTGEWRQNGLLKFILYFFLLYSALLWVTNLLLNLGKMGLTYGSVVAYYRGAEEQFLQPRSYLGLLEIAHFHVFAMGILILTLTHLVLFVPIGPRLKFWLIGVSFFSALSNEGGGWLTRFVHPAFAYFKIGSFVLFQVSLGALVLIVFFALLFSQRKAYSEGLGNSGHDPRPLAEDE